MLRHCSEILWLGVGAHGWVARICQPSRSWLPIVEVPGCLRHPTSTCKAVVKTVLQKKDLVKKAWAAVSTFYVAFV